MLSQLCAPQGPQMTLQTCANTHHNLMCRLSKVTCKTLLFNIYSKIKIITRVFHPYSIHLTLCSDVTRKCNKRTQLLRMWHFCVGVFIHAIKVNFWLAYVNTEPITDLRAYMIHHCTDLDEQGTMERATIHYGTIKHQMDVTV